MSSKKIGQRIKKARLKLNLTQEGLADLLNLSVSYVSLIERGERNATLDTLISISHALDVPIDFLLADETSNGSDEYSLSWVHLTKGCSGEEKQMLLDIVKTAIELCQRRNK